MPDDDIIHVRLIADTLDALRSYAEETGADLGCRPVAKKTKAGYQIDAYLPESVLNAAEAVRLDVGVERVENFTQASQARRSEVGAGNRYAVRGAIPRGLGRKE